MNPVINWLKNRIHKQNKNNLIIICGETGSGKSWRALRIAEALNPKFSMDYVVFKSREFFNLLTTGKLKKGSVIIWEEGGVEASNRNWYSILNKQINYAFQTMRHRNFTLIMTVPSIGFIDSALRPLFHLYIECLYIDRVNDCCKCKVLRMQHNPRLGKTFYKYFRVRGASGLGSIGNPMWINSPSPELITAYEERKTEFTKDLYKDCLAEIDKAETNAKKDWGKPKTYEAEIEEVKSILKTNPGELTTNYNGVDIVSWKKVRQKLGVSTQGAKIITAVLG